ncbi:hypothetical protein P170DRAFT_442779 [Aspergillus steynii IBT 23096]|uniref:Hydrophobin n=1 Tax=Aspergillus steynii IBT 23096 TaxID=1392250 RepID=A0A2I2GPE7_9EURO|nr:uncharacterized protein P170DRAFT_442779 [Aspergillus steynii IBT 23096]PLB54750.1 hypothetical protein P170DRAFT_442779 [Aspergillus steynii IBT 23096]
MTEQKPSSEIVWPAPKGMTVTEASSKCGEQAQLSCCNKASKGGDTTNVHEGGGQLSGVLGAGSASEGGSLFSECSKLDAQVTVLLLLGVQDVLDQQCKQNVACCQGNKGDASDSLIGATLSCVGLGSIL